jgi:hypothetical protein
MKADDGALSWFEVPRAVAESVVVALRLGNTAADVFFYDVGELTAQLLRQGVVVNSDSPAPSAASSRRSGLSEIGLSALANPEGSILIVDTARPPYVRHRFDDVREFIRDYRTFSPAVRNVSITGVGSSALGSVAFAWDISAALGEPVAAIVPGYGVADIAAQALGGWLGFGLFNWLKQQAQDALVTTSPELARIGRRLKMTIPGDEKAAAPVFERGSGSSDVLHAILREGLGIGRLFGHSKGALAIENAVRDLPPGVTAQLDIVTFGCPIAKIPGARYRQILGWFDGLGMLNSWGNKPDVMIPARHSTNSWLSFSMPITPLTQEFARVEEGKDDLADPLSRGRLSMTS